MRIQSHEGLVKYKTCLIFFLSTAKARATTTDPNQLCKHCSQLLEKSIVTDKTAPVEHPIKVSNINSDLCYNSKTLVGFIVLSI